ncbi:PASTA domain-containing protein, partial [uncultured Nitrospira sp.]|uniref:PASTA domain-containing protein n=1 Tax=uncultured Nitrospira sp. TaxID=157176 RepID=UPI0031406FEE
MLPPHEALRVDTVEQQLKDVRTLPGRGRAQGCLLRLLMSMVLVSILLPSFAFSTAWAEVVPDVVGSSQITAESEITGAGLTVGAITITSHASVPSGNVISQNPAAGIDVVAGSPVDLVVSDGPALVTVPSVVGLPQSDAESAIIGAGLTVGTITTASHASVSSGSVISQTPGGGASVAAGSAVALVVSTGPAPVTVPNVVGVPQAAAQAALTTAG